MDKDEAATRLTCRRSLNPKLLLFAAVVTVHSNVQLHYYNFSLIFRVGDFVTLLAHAWDVSVTQFVRRYQVFYSAAGRLNTCLVTGKEQTVSPPWLMMNPMLLMCSKRKPKNMIRYILSRCRLTVANHPYRMLR